MRDWGRRCRRRPWVLQPRPAAAHCGRAYPLTGARAPHSCAHTTFACNSPATVSNLECSTLEFQRFLIVSKPCPIELHCSGVEHARQQRCSGTKGAVVKQDSGASMPWSTYGAEGNAREEVWMSKLIGRTGCYRIFSRALRQYTSFDVATFTRCSAGKVVVSSWGYERLRVRCAGEPRPGMDDRVAQCCGCQLPCAEW